MDSLCRIELLGGLRVHQTGRCITRFRTGNSGLLLAYLAYFHDRSHPREILIDMLWPDCEPRTARHRLSVILASLRRQLEPPGIPAGTIIQADRSALRLNAEAVSIDAVDFLETMRAAGRREAPEQRLALLEQAMRMYRAGLLTGYYAEWVIAEQRRLQAISEKARDVIRALRAQGVKSARPVPEQFAAQPTSVRCPRVALPLTLTRFFGRGSEIDRIASLLAPSLDGGPDTVDGRPGVSPSRLLTLTGPGGSGKTRLAIEAARRCAPAFAGRVWFVGLADISDPGLIGAAIVSALGMEPAPTREPLDQVTAHLNRAEGGASLLVLDNVEHLLYSDRANCQDGASVVRTLLERAPSLSCLVTSRETLSLDGERELCVEPLATPNGDVAAPEALMEYSGVALFVDRSQAARADFQVTAHNAKTVARLCDRLEGLPLAIELCAARAQVLTPAQMLAQLDDRFTFLVSRKRDAVNRHRTLRAAIEWSCRLLPPEAQRFFARLSVFRGGWTVEAAEAVCEEPRALVYLERLRECSLVLAQETEHGMRFRILESVREYAAHQLTDRERAYCQRRHGEHFLKAAERAWSIGRYYALESDVDNLRASFAWALDADPELALRLAITLSRMWTAWGSSRDAYRWLCDALERNPQPTMGRAHALYELWHLISFGGQEDMHRRDPLLAEFTAIYRTLADPGAIAKAAHAQGLAAMEAGQYSAARFHLEEGLETNRQLNDQLGCANLLTALGVLAMMEGDYDQARAVLQESLRLFDEAGERGTWNGAANTLLNLGRLYTIVDDYSEARKILDKALTHYRRMKRTPGICSTIASLGELALAQGEYQRATALIEESLKIAMDTETFAAAAHHMAQLGLIALTQGEPERAAMLFRDCLAFSTANATASGVAYSLDGVGMVAASQAPMRQAPRLFGAAEAIRQSNCIPLWPTDRRHYDCYVAAARASLGEEEFARSWAEGRALTLDEAIACALDEASAPPMQ